MTKQERIKNLENIFYKQMQKTINLIDQGVIDDYEVAYKEMKTHFLNFDTQRRKLYEEVENEN